MVVTDVETDEQFAPWREAARRRGLPLARRRSGSHQGGTPTVLALYAAEPGVFEAEVVEVIEELAGDVGFALRSIEADRERTQALEDLRSSEAALRESEARFKRLAENAPDVIYRLRLWPSPAVEYVNRAIEVIGHSPEEFLADPGLLPRLIHPGDRHVMAATFRGELSAMQPSRIRSVRDDDSTKSSTKIHSVAVRDSEGRVVAVEDLARRHGTRRRRSRCSAALGRGRAEPRLGPDHRHRGADRVRELRLHPPHRLHARGDGKTSIPASSSPRLRPRRTRISGGP